MESCNFNGNKSDKSDIRSFQKAGKALLYVYIANENKKEKIFVVRYTYLSENKEA